MNKEYDLKYVENMISKMEITKGEEQVPISKEQSLYLLNLVKEIQPKRTLEIGIGYGMSAAMFLEGGSKKHYVVELAPYPRSLLGKKNAEIFDKNNTLNVIFESSDYALPKFSTKEKFDIILIDGEHRFDTTFLDFYYSKNLISNGGYIILDDLWMDSIKSVCSWIDNNLPTIFTKIETNIKNFAVYKKTNEIDTRNWDHFVPFFTNYK